MDLNAHARNPANLTSNNIFSIPAFIIPMLNIFYSLISQKHKVLASILIESLTIVINLLIEYITINHNEVTNNYPKDE